MAKKAIPHIILCAIPLASCSGVLTGQQTITGSGEIRYSGSLARVHKKVNGSGNIRESAWCKQELSANE